MIFWKSLKKHDADFEKRRENFGKSEKEVAFCCNSLSMEKPA